MPRPLSRASWLTIRCGDRTSVWETLVPQEETWPQLGSVGGSTTQWVLRSTVRLGVCLVDAQMLPGGLAQGVREYSTPGSQAAAGTSEQARHGWG